MPVADMSQGIDVEGTGDVFDIFKTAKRFVCLKRGTINESTSTKRLPLDEKGSSYK